KRHPSVTSSTTVAIAAGVVIVALAVSLMLWSQRLGRLEALESLNQFQEDSRTAQFLLTTRAADADQLDEGLKAARRALDRYQAVDNPAWMDLPAVSRLPDEE